jgi:hypothetical protein
LKNNKLLEELAVSCVNRGSATLFTQATYTSWIIRDATDIKLHPNINMENEMVSRKPRKPLIHSPKEWRKPPHEDTK